MCQLTLKNKYPAKTKVCVYKYLYIFGVESGLSVISIHFSYALSFQLLIKQGATKLTKEDIEKVFSLYDRVSTNIIYTYYIHIIVLLYYYFKTGQQRHHWEWGAERFSQGSARAGQEGKCRELLDIPYRMNDIYIYIVHTGRLWCPGSGCLWGDNHAWRWPW